MAQGKQAYNAEIEFRKGMAEAFEVMRQIYELPCEDMRTLFGESLPKLIVNKWTSDQIYDIMKNKKKILAQCVAPGDVVSVLGNNIIITWVDKDRLHFDGIWDDGPRRGHVINNRTIEDLGAKKELEYDTQAVYCIHVDETEDENYADDV